MIFVYLLFILYQSIQKVTIYLNRIKDDYYPDRSLDLECKLPILPPGLVSLLPLLPIELFGAEPLERLAGELFLEL